MAYGIINHVKIDPLSYNIGFLGLSGIGKTTIIKEFCEKLAGKDGYLFLEFGKEDGADAIEGIKYVNCPQWSMDFDKSTNSIGFEEVTDDILENKSTEYPNLKVVVIDTYDQLVDIAKPEVIRLHNKEYPDKKVKSIKAAFGGYMAGEDKVDEMILTRLWDLKKVGVHFIIIGHTKRRELTDEETQETYEQITTNMSMRSFNAIKTKLHFLGVATIDRKIIKEKKANKSDSKGKIAQETRKITFRDDNYSIDSKSRFKEIIPEIPFDSDELIKAITDAIKAEQSKSNKSFDEAKEEQDKEAEKRMKEIEAQQKINKENKELKDNIDTIQAFIVKNKANKEVITPILLALKKHGLTNLQDIDDLKTSKEILKLTK